MTNDKIEDLNSINQEEDTIENEDETTEEESEEEESDKEEKLTALEKKVKELEAQKKHWKEKAVKKEAPKSDEGLSQKDLYALMNHGVHEDDIDEVVAFAKLKNIPVKDALQSNIVKSILKEKEEVRKSAEVTNTKTSRKSPQEKDADQILGQIRKGEFPTDAKDMVKAFDKLVGLSK
jgi:hypothetical protein